MSGEKAESRGGSHGKSKIMYYSKHHQKALSVAMDVMYELAFRGAYG
jgi:hypothetical protein